MSMISSFQAEQQAILTAADLIMAAITTSPKGRGVSSLTCAIIEGEEKERLAQAMEEHISHKKTRLEFFKRDAQNIRRSGVVILLGVKGTMPKKPEMPLNCGACGYPACGGLMGAEKRMGEDFTGPLCAFQVMDLGIALGVAAKMAAELNMDNRMMYSAGAAAKALGYLDADLIIALPLSVSEKNIFFDRP